MKPTTKNQLHRNRLSYQEMMAYLNKGYYDDVLFEVEKKLYNGLEFIPEFDEDLKEQFEALADISLILLKHAGSEKTRLKVKQVTGIALDLAGLDYLGISGKLLQKVALLGMLIADPDLDDWTEKLQE